MNTAIAASHQVTPPIHIQIYQNYLPPNALSIPENSVKPNGWKSVDKALAAVTVPLPVDSIPICRCWNCG